MRKLGLFLGKGSQDQTVVGNRNEELRGGESWQSVLIGASWGKDAASLKHGVRPDTMMRRNKSCKGGGKRKLGA